VEIVLVILVVLVVAGVAVAYSRRGGGPDRPALPQRSPEDEQRALHGDVRKLGPGDVVSYEGTDFIVDRTMHFDQEGFTWKEHLLTDPVASRRMWLGVEDDDGLEVTLWERVSGVTLEPGPGSLDHDGVTYEREEQGRARFHVEETGGTTAEQGTMEFADYSAGEQLLAFERYGTGSWEVSTGRVVSEHALDVYPRG
jgi:hypothetical protein